jgi:hypothetical protein
MPLSRRQPETQDPYLVVARPTAALLDANNQITAEVPDSIRLLYKSNLKWIPPLRHRTLKTQSS